jgi:branched-chain amino acid transport system permease protein
MVAPAAGAFEPSTHLNAQVRWSGYEIAFWLATLLPFLVFPNHLVLASQIAITALFALSLDLILGYAGIVSLGHAAFFGLGAYTAGIVSKYGWTDPFVGLLAGPAVAGLVGYATSFIIARFRHLPLIMITMGLGFMLHEAANSAEWLTGGSDGLQGVQKGRLFGTITFDLYGYTAYAYSLTVLLLVFLAVRRLINSPFGLTLRGIRENPMRMPAIGAPSRAHIRKVYTISAVIAGMAGNPGHPRAWRRWAALRRPRRRHHLHGGARPVLGHRTTILVLLDRRPARHRCDAAAQRHPWWVGST